MNKNIRKFVSIFTIIAMLSAFLPAYAADEFEEKMLGYEENVEEISLFSSVEAFSSEGEVLIDKQSGFSSSDFLSSTNFAEVGSVCGKASDDTCARVTAKSQDTYFNSGSMTIDMTKYYVMEFNIYPQNNFSHLYFATKSHSALSARVYNNSLIQNSWNKIQMVYNPSAGVSNLYVNGSDKGVITLSDTAVEHLNVGKQGFRIVMAPTSSYGDYNTMTVCVDNIKLYTSNEYVRDYPVKLDNVDYGTHCADNANGDIYLIGEFNVGQLKEYFDGDNVLFSQVLNKGIVMPDTEKLKVGYTFVATDNNNVSRSYSLKAWTENYPIIDGEGAKASNKFTGGEMKIRTRTYSTDTTLSVAQYDCDGNIINIATSSVVKSGKLVCDFEAVPLDGSYLKIFVWDSTNTLRPRTPTVTYHYRSKDVNVLFVGSENVISASKYLRPIAMSDGIDMGVGVLYADNANYKQQLDNVSTDEFNTFLYNGINYGKHSLDTVAEEYNWDYVVLQNHISSYDDMYTSNWTPVASNLIKYIKTKLPDSNVFTASPVPHQIGYKYSSEDLDVIVDKTVFKEITNYLSTQTKNSAGIASVNNNINVKTADIASLYSYISGTTVYSAEYYDEGHENSASTGGSKVSVSGGILSPEDVSAGKTTLYADGIHASYAGSLLQSMYMYCVLTGESITENTYSPDGEYVVECDNMYADSGKISYVFSKPDDNTISDFRRVVAGFEIYGNNQVYLKPKTNGFDPKAADSIIVDEKFDEYNGSALGNGWVIENSSSKLTMTEDTDCGGKYLNIKTPTASAKVTANKFFASNGGNVRFDMQLRINNEYGNAAFNMYGFNYSEAQNRSSGLSIAGNKLYITDISKSILQLIPGQWYNITLCYNSDYHMYDIYVNGKCVAANVSYANKIRSFECFVISVPSNGITDIDIDNIRMSHIEPGEFPTQNSISDILYENNFDDYINNTILKEDARGSIYAKNENGNGYVWAERTSSESGSCSTNFYFPSVKDNVTVEFDVRLDDLSGATKVISIQGGMTATIYFSGKTLSVLDEADKRPICMKNLTAGKWYHIKLVTKAENGVFEIYVDGVCVMDNAPYQSTGTPSFDNIRFAITSGVPSSFAMDNLKVTNNKDYRPEDVSYEGYAPDADAPNSYDWQKNYVSLPSGDVYEAEDMSLYNYTVFSDASYNGGSGVAVEGSGYGTAQFTFGGKSGYYAINVGYGESVDNFDSFYELKQNGERIDWWIGQYDDDVHHVRNTRRYHYVANGDRFKIIGKGGSDPSKLDYVEFAPAESLDNFTYGDLIEDDGLHPGMWRTSSWDATEDGGYVRKGKTVYDCRTDAKCELIRNIYPTDASFIFDYTMNVSSATDCILKIGDGVNFPVWYRFANKSITTVAQTYSNAYSHNSSRLYRVAVDNKNKTYTLLINGNVLAENVPFDGDVDKFSQIRFESSDAGTCSFSVSSVKLTAGYHLYETFRPYSSGTVPYDWDISYSEPVTDSESGELTEEAQPQAVSKSMNSEGNDSKSLRISPNGVAKKSFDPISGKITFETNFILPEAKNNVYLQIGNGDKYIGFYTKSGKIYYDTNKGFDRALWDDYKSNIWYTLRIELDTEKGRADFIVNDFKKAENITINLSSVDNVKFSSGENDGYLWIDDVALVNDIYTSSVPAPEKPELKDDYTIVMECCDLWREGNHFGNYSYSPFDNRIPLLGYLEDGNIEVAEWETKFMAEHGITTYVPCWYTNTNYNNSPVKEPRNSAKLHAFLKSKYCQQLDFAILITVVSNSGGVDGFVNNYVNFWIERYFKAPNYWKIGNKPVIPIYDVNSVNNIAGGKNDSTAELIKRINEKLIENGFDGGVYIGIHNDKITTTVNGYDYKYRYHMGSSPVGTTVISSLLNNQSSDDVGYIASPSQGWGNEAWGRADRKYNIPLTDWYGSLKWIRDVYMPSQNDTSLTSKTLWLGNWNEYSEGHALAPSRITGFGYLDGVRKVFTNGSVDHYDELPDKYFDQMTAITWK